MRTASRNIFSILNDGINEAREPMGASRIRVRDADSKANQSGELIVLYSLANLTACGKATEYWMSVSC